jgi:chromosomal replication initiation ATPase DnaA
MGMTLTVVKDEPDFAQPTSPWRQYLSGKHLAAAAPDIIGISKYDLYGSSRRAEYCQPRAIVMLALRRLGLRYHQVALLTGRTDHTTAMHGVKQAKILINQYKDYADLLRALEGDVG